MNIETAKRLYEYRKANGYSQEELAAKIGVSRQAISKWERSESSPDTENLIALAKLYGVTLDTLLMGEAEPSAAPKEPEKAEADAEEKEKPQEQPAESGEQNASQNGAAAAQGAPVTYYPAAESGRGKLSKKAKITIAAIAGVAVFIIAASLIGFNIYDEISEERAERLHNSAGVTASSGQSGASQDGGAQSGAAAYTADPSAVRKLSIDWGAGSVDIKYYDGDVISFDDGIDPASSDALVYKLQGGELDIDFCRRDGLRSDEKSLVVNIPNGVSLSELDIEAGAGSITVNGITAAKLDAVTASGAITAAGSFSEIDIETQSGRADISTTAQQIRKIDAEVSSGSAIIRLPQSISGFYAEYEARSGKVRTDFDARETVSGSHGILSYGDSSTQIDAEVLSGDLLITHN